MYRLGGVPVTNLLIGRNLRAILVAPDEPVQPVPPEAEPALARIVEAARAAVGDSRAGRFEAEGVPWRAAVVKGAEPVLSLRPLIHPVPAFGELGLPGGVTEHLISLADQAGLVEGVGGLVLMIGPPGHGKTTTAGSLLLHWLQERGGLAVTIEYPRELLLDRTEPPAVCIQQELPDESGWGDELAEAVRYGARYVFLGEVRTPPAAAAALQAAATGHVVLTTIHGATVPQGLANLLKLATASGMMDRDLALLLLAQGLAAALRLQRRVDDSGATSLEVWPLLPAADEARSSTAIRAAIEAGSLRSLNEYVDRHRRMLCEGRRRFVIRGS